MIVLISLSLIIPFLMILSAQKRDYETLIEQMTSDYEEVLENCKQDVIKSHQQAHKLSCQVGDLEAKLEAEELKVMRSCRNWSKMPQFKCAVNPSGSCLECRDYEVLGK
jgi:hypothetical protein